jgi:hypothetical protein
MLAIAIHPSEDHAIREPQGISANPYLPTSRDNFVAAMRAYFVAIDAADSDRDFVLQIPNLTRVTAARP